MAVPVAVGTSSRRLAPRAVAGVLMTGVSGAVVPVVFLSGTPYLGILTLAGIFAIVVVGLNLISGYAGLLSLGQGGVFAVGAYASAMLTTKAAWPPEAAMVIAVLAAMSVAWATSPILRLSGFYFALATLCLALIVEAVLRNSTDITGGASGITAIPHLRLFGFSFQRDLDYHLLAWAVLTGALLLTLSIDRSRTGRALRSIHLDDTAAQSFGIDTTSVKLKVWILASGFAGLAGAIYAHYVRFTSPDQFGLWPSIVLLVMMIIGGAGTIVGPAIGAVVIRVIPELSAGLDQWAPLAFGVALVIVTVAMPEGIAGRVRRLVTADDGPVLSTDTILNDVQRPARSAT